MAKDAKTNSRKEKITKKREEVTRRRKNSETSDDSDHDNHSDSDGEDDEMDVQEYRKFLSKIFPSKHLNKKIKAGEKLKKLAKAEEEEEEEEEEETKPKKKTNKKKASSNKSKKSKKNNKEESEEDEESEEELVDFSDLSTQTMIDLVSYYISKKMIKSFNYHDLKDPEFLPLYLLTNFFTEAQFRLDESLDGIENGPYSSNPTESDFTFKSD